MLGSVLGIDVGMHVLEGSIAYPPDEYEFLTEAPIAMQALNGISEGSNGTYSDPIRVALFIDLVGYIGIKIKLRKIDKLSLHNSFF